MGCSTCPCTRAARLFVPAGVGLASRAVGEVLRLLGVTTRSLSTHDLRLNQANQITGGALSLSVTSPLFNLCVKSILTLFDLATAAMLAVGGSVGVHAAQVT